MMPIDKRKDSSRGRRLTEELRGTGNLEREKVSRSFIELDQRYREECFTSNGMNASGKRIGNIKLLLTTNPNSFFSIENDTN